MVSHWKTQIFYTDEQLKLFWGWKEIPQCERCETAICLAHEKRAWRRADYTPLLKAEDTGSESALWVSRRRCKMQFRAVFKPALKAASIISFNTREVTSFLRGGWVLQSFRPLPGKRTEDKSPALTHPVVTAGPATRGLGPLQNLHGCGQESYQARRPARRWYFKSLHLQEIRANDVSRLLLPLKNLWISRS